MIDLNLPTTNHYKLLMELGGKCRICLSDKFEDIEIDHIYNDGAEERAKYGGGDKILTFYLSNIELAFRRLQPLCKRCHDTKTWSQNPEQERIDLEILQGRNHEEQSKMQIFMDMLKKLEGENKSPVLKALLIDELVKTGKFDVSES